MFGLSPTRMKRGLRRSLDEWRGASDTPIEFSAADVTPEIQRALSPQIDELELGISCRPYEDNGGIEDMLEPLHSWNDPVFRRGENVTEAHAFEIRYVGDVVQFQFVPGSPYAADTMYSQLQVAYPDSKFAPVEPALVHVDEGMHVSMARLELAEYVLKPIKHIGLEGFDTDPFTSITKEMVGMNRELEFTDVVIQVMFKPASYDWVDGVGDGPSVDMVADGLEQPTYETHRRPLSRKKEEVELPASDKAKQAAKYIRNLRGEDGWHCNIRVITIADDPKRAAVRTEKVAGMFRNFYESHTQQKFVPVPVTGKKLTPLLEKMARREFVDRGQVFSLQEAAGFIHVPNADINNHAVNWLSSTADGGVPPGLPGFEEHDAVGYFAGDPAGVFTGRSAGEANGTDSTDTDDQQDTNEREIRA